jgi:dTDP-4-amino-4,6-dideoxygalactose transaminase
VSVAKKNSAISAVNKFFKKMAWYAPAETKIPLTAIFSSLFSSKGDFEKALCNYLCVNQCLLANSGRSLLSSLLKILKHKNKDERNEVLIPGYTCYSVAASVARAGLKVRVYDMDPATLNPDIDSLTRATTPGTLAIIGQHLFGLPAPIDELKEIAQTRNIYLVEDAAQALGGTLNGQPLGTIGDFGFYSFGRGKPLPVGSGGALIGRHKDVLSELKLNKNKTGTIPFIKTAIAQLLSWPMLYSIPEMLPLGLGETVFDPDFDISTMPAIMEKLAKRSFHILEDLNAHRRYIASIYQGTFDNGSVIPVSKETSPIYARFPYMAGSGTISAELKRLGVRRMYPKAITDEKSIRPYLAFKQGNTPGASEIAQNLITLPTNMRITENLANEIAQRVKTAYRRIIG